MNDVSFRGRAQLPVTTACLCTSSLPFGCNLDERPLVLSTVSQRVDDYSARGGRERRGPAKQGGWEYGEIGFCAGPS